MKQSLHEFPIKRVNYKICNALDSALAAISKVLLLIPNPSIFQAVVITAYLENQISGTLVGVSYAERARVYFERSEPIWTKMS